MMTIGYQGEHMHVELPIFGGSYYMNDVAFIS